MDPEIRKTAKEIGKRLGIPVEAKKIGNQYYVYKDTTKWDSERKKRVRVSEYIGRIDENGLVEKNRTTIHEYGNSELAMEILDCIVPDLKKSFPEHWEDIAAMALIRTIEPVPIKLMKSRWEKLYASQQIDAHLSPNTVSEILRTIGGDFDAQRRFFHSLIEESKYLIFDLSSLFSRSENINIAEKGYNPHHEYIKQINFVLVFSRKGKPVIMEPLPGSVRDMKAFDSLIDTYDLRNAIIIADRGLSSYEITDRMRKRRIGFIVAIRRNMDIIDYAMPMEKSFVYHDRGINAAVKKTDHGFLYMYEDVLMRAEEETNFISMVEDGSKTMDQLSEARRRFGKISILSSIKDDPENIFNLYKEREEIEQAFDAMKNELENDKSYLQDTIALRGYFFISFLSLYIYFSILQMLKSHDLHPKISVKECLLELSKIYAISTGARRSLSEIPMRSAKLAETLGIKLYPKILRN